jgi:sodium transport system permease protein
MNWSNVKLIFLREVRDQLRDRRTLFTIAVLPLLLYPLLGMTFLQVAQFVHERPTHIWVVGADHLSQDPPLIDGDHFHADVCSADEARLLVLDTERRVPDHLPPGEFAAHARRLIQDGTYSAVVLFPDGFAQALEKFRATNGGNAAHSGVAPGLPTPELIFDAANDKSRVTNVRLRRVLSTWQRQIVRQYLSERNISPNVTDPFAIKDVDVSVEMSRRAAFWSKVLPFVVFVWALTGAFYPAVDLCAGEKERGTLETLLSSPAQRSEIVMGKLLTIMGFSSATALLNLLNMTLTGTVVIMLQPNQFPIGAPPAAAVFWLVLALIPISALFSALALAIAAFARSTKEGQYYLMPLLVISLPLMILPVLPSVEMNLGTSLVPITGMMLLLKAMVEGQFADVAIYAPPVLFVTGGCCYLAIRWAVDQFNNESVLFRESERTDIRLWLRHLIRERGATPTIAQAIACALLLLTIRFFASAASTTPQTWSEFARMQFITLAVLIAVPVLIMSVFLTRNARATLLLNPAAAKTILMAVLLAVTLHPVAMLVAEGVMQLYPVNEEVTRQVSEISSVIASAPSIWYILGLLALVPAICEELAFRGFILSGLRHMGSRWGAIALSSLFFGITHGILQQSISATLVGMVLGYIAIQTGSLLPCIAFHLAYNSLSLLSSFVLSDWVRENAWLQWAFRLDGESASYGWPLIAVGAILAVAILWWFRRLPHMMTPEEELHKALRHQSANAAAS